MEILTEYLPLLLPLALIQLILIVVAIFDLRKRSRTRGPKWVWALVIIFVNFIGPLLYFVIAREDE
jgi:hypothetical protein